MSKKKARKLQAQGLKKRARAGAGAVRGPPVSKKRRRQAAAEDLEKRQLAAKAKRKKAAEKSRSLTVLSWLRRAAGLPLGYDSSQRVLLVGEGNFSFARALLRLFGGQGSGIVATAFDPEATVLEKYDEGEDPVSGIVNELREAGARVKYGVDASALRKGLKAMRKRGGLRDEELTFDRIAFNFPHVGLGIKDQDVNVARNQALLAAFFASAVPLLAPGGEVHVALKTGAPYDAWNPVGCAHHATGGSLQLKTSAAFDPDAFPGYAHRRALGFREGLSDAQNSEVRGRSRAFIFHVFKTRH